MPTGSQKQQGRREARQGSGLCVFQALLAGVSDLPEAGRFHKGQESKQALSLLAFIRSKFKRDPSLTIIHMDAWHVGTLRGMLAAKYASKAAVEEALGVTFEAQNFKGS